MAVKQFWTTRQVQSLKQGGTTGRRDAGQRTAVTGGAQMNGFVALMRELLFESGVARTHVYCEQHIEIPGWYRPEKKWDRLVVEDGELLAGIEFKSQVGSFGNNYNNRTEEAIGSAVDVWAAYREGAFKPSVRPWLGYLMLLEDTPKSTTPVGAREPHFECLSRIPRGVLRKTIRNTPHETRSRANVRFGVLPPVQFKDRQERRLPETLCRTKFPELRFLALGSRRRKFRYAIAQEPKGSSDHG